MKRSELVNKNKPLVIGETSRKRSSILQKRAEETAQNDYLYAITPLSLNSGDYKSLRFNPIAPEGSPVNPGSGVRIVSREVYDAAMKERERQQREKEASRIAETKAKLETGKKHDWRNPGGENKEVDGEADSEVSKRLESHKVTDPIEDFANSKKNQKKSWLSTEDFGDLFMERFGDSSENKKKVIDGQTFYNDYAMQMYLDSKKRYIIENGSRQNPLFSKFSSETAQKVADEDFKKHIGADITLHNVINGHKTVGATSPYFKYSLLTKDEKETYNYLASFTEPKKVLEYLNLIDNDLEQRKAHEVAKKIDATRSTNLKTLAVATSSFASGLESIGKASMRLNGGSSPMMNRIAYNPSYGKILSSALIENEDSAVRKLILNVVSTVSNQAPALAYGLYTGGAGYGFALGNQVTSDSIAEAVQNNKTIESGFVYGLAQTALELSLEKLFGGIASKISGKGTSSFVSKMMNKIDDVVGNKKVASLIKKTLSLSETGAGEFLQEFTQAMTDPMLRNIIYNENNTYSAETLTDALYQGLIGFFAGGVMAAPTVKASVSNVQYTKIGEMSNAKNVLKLCEDAGYRHSDSYAEVKNSVEKGKTVDNATLGRLSVEVTQAIYDNTHFTEEYMATVANLGTTEQIAELMFGGNTEAAVKFKEKYSSRSVVDEGLSREYNNEVSIDENNRGGTYESVETDLAEWGQGGHTGERTGTLQENLGRNNDQGRATRIEQGGSPGIRSGERGGNRKLTSEQSEGLKTTAIKNEDGTPKTVYHFTDNMEFDVFAKGDIGFHFGNETQATARGSIQNKNGRTITAYLDIKNPLNISTDIMSWRPRNLALKLLSDGTISVEQYRNILKMDSDNAYSYDDPAAIELRRILADKGYDGIVYQNMFEGDGESYIAFYPEQVIIINDGKGDGHSSSPTSQVENGESVFNISARGDRKDAVTRSIEKVTGHYSLNEHQKLLYEVGAQFGAKVRFANLDYVVEKEVKVRGADGRMQTVVKKITVSPEGQFDPDTNTITLNTSVKPYHRPVEYILKHEMTHSLEVDPESYNLFAKEVLGSEEFLQYAASKINPETEEAFGSSDAWMQYIIKSYAHKGASLGEGTEAQYKAKCEMVANFVGDMLFGGRGNISAGLMAEISTEAKTGLVGWIQRFFEKVKQFFKGRPELTEIERLEQEFLKAARSVAVFNRKVSESGVFNRNQNPAENEKTTTEDRKSYSLFSGSKTSENLYDTPDNLKPDSETEWSTFNRQFANKTNNLKENQKNNIMIYTADYAYFVSASGYMRGRIVAKIEIDGNEEFINDFRREFENGTFESSKRFDLLAQSIRSDRGRGYRRHASLKETLAAERNGELDGETHGRNRGRNNRGSRKTSKNVSYSLPETTPEALLELYKRGEISDDEFIVAIKKNKHTQRNPIEIANLTEEDADTTPTLPQPKGKGDGDGESKLYGSLLESGIITDEVKAEIANDTYIKNYGTTTNKAELQAAAERLEQGGKEEVDSWRVRGENVSAVDVAEGIILLKQYQDAGDISGAIVIAERLREIASLSGQAVQAFSIIGRFTPEMMVAYAKHELGKAREKMVALKTDEWLEANKSRFELTEEEIRMITDHTILASKLQDGSRTKAVLLGEITTLLQNKLPPEKGQAMRAWVRTSLLLNPKTQLRNVLGNATMVMPYVGSDMFGGLIDAAIATKTGVRTTGFDAKIFGKSFAEGMKKGAVETIDDYKRKIHTKQEELDRFETNRGSGKSFNELHTGKLAKQLNSVARALNEVDRLNSMFLELGDRPFFEAWFANELNTLMKLNKTETPTKEMVEQAKQIALQRTWQDNNRVTKAASGLRKALNVASIGGYGLGDVVLKFVKTPANIAKAMVEFSPVGFAPAMFRIKELNRAIKKGSFTPAMQKEAVRSFSNAVVGTAVYLLGYALIAAGVLDISGDGDDDKDVSNFEKYVLGVPPYSFEFFGTRVTYTWNQPFGTVIATVAELMDESKKGTLDGWDVISTVGEVFTSQSFLQNLYEFFSKDDALTGLASLVISEPSATIPTLFSQMASLTDPYRRTAYQSGSPIKSALNDVIYRIPVLRQMFLPKQVNTLGEENKNPQFLNPWFAFIDPSTQYPKSSSMVAQNIYELYEKTGDKTVMPRVAPYKVTIKGKTVNFSIDERNEIQRQMGAVSSEILGELFASAEFGTLSEEEQTKAVSKVYEYAYAKIKAGLDIYDYDTLSQIVGTKKNGDPILSAERYSRLNDKARQMLVDEYFFSDDEIKCKGNPTKLAELFMKKIKK